jgi:predicted component of type VI protein secretion system
MPYIEIEGQSRPVGPGVLTIGSGTEAGWRITGRGLAPLHLMVVPELNGRLNAVPGSGDADVSVNGEALEGRSHTLADGDVMRLGHDVTATFRLVSRRARDSREAFLRDTLRGRVYRVANRSEIGRDLRSTVLLQEPDVSRTHAEIVEESEGFVLHPRGGVTLLNGHRVTEPAPLHEGDELVVGRTHLRFSREVPRSSLAAPGAAGRHDSRAARMRTTFMGTVALREHEQRMTRKKLGRVAAIVAIALAVAAGLVATLGAGSQTAGAAGRAAVFNGSGDRPAPR